MIVHIFDDKIDAKNINALINTLVSYDSLDVVNIYFCTSGGETTPMNALIEFLNSSSNKYIVTLVDFVCSAGVDIILKFKGKIRYHYSLQYILFHKSDMRILTERKWGEVDESKYMPYIKAENNDFLKQMPFLGFTKGEINRFRKGYDVVIYRKDFDRMNFNWKKDD